ncbi:MAG: malto-oligosyltrehalose trehalohydrolase [Myxococcus sp.]|nr:malto-oligosyltrehalose trehalohydrolase [Myxococcus sp.]
MPLSTPTEGLGLGAQVEPGGVRFAVWAPRAQRVEAVLLGQASRSVELTRGEGDVFAAFAPHAAPGDDYGFRLDGGALRPDPASRWQPQGVHGPSRVVDPRAFAWRDGAWAGLPQTEYVFYELHVGTFTPEGTFDAAISKLGHLKALGVTAVELMPVAEFPGARNWGYDGVFWFAPQSSYGGPEALRRLIDACHGAGLAVVLDVVFNHLGPEGNRLPEFGPYFSEQRRTPWGDGLDFDNPAVVRHVVAGARAWLEEFHVDALRLDAAQHLDARVVGALVSAVDGHAARHHKQAFVIAETNRNDVRLLEPTSEGGLSVHAQWNDDFHLALRAALTGERAGHAVDFGSMADVAQALTHGFVLDGRWSTYRGGVHGSSSADRPGEQLVIFTQNHDQVANGAFGARSAHRLSLEEQKLELALLCWAPNLPMLFMGQEWGEVAPFYYFTSHEDASLARAVREGRARELVALGAKGPLADPQAVTTFEACKLDWGAPGRRPHAELLACTRDLLALRRAIEALRNCRKDLARVEVHEAERWLILTRLGAPSMYGVFNFRREPATVPRPRGVGGLQLLWCSSDARFGGPGGRPVVGEAGLHLPASCAALFSAAA